MITPSLEQSHYLSLNNREWNPEKRNNWHDSFVVSQQFISTFDMALNRIKRMVTSEYYSNSHTKIFPLCVNSGHAYLRIFIEDIVYTEHDVLSWMSTWSWLWYCRYVVALRLYFWRCHTCNHVLAKTHRSHKNQITDKHSAQCERYKLDEQSNIKWLIVYTSVFSRTQWQSLIKIKLITWKPSADRKSEKHDTQTESEFRNKHMQWFNGLCLRNTSVFIDRLPPYLLIPPTDRTHTVHKRMLASAI